MDYIQPYLDYFSANPEWAITLIFLISLGEALLIIGLFVPSTAVLVGAGMLVGTGTLGFWPVFFATASGAIIGDQLSYWVGRMYGVQLKNLWPLSRYPQLVARGEDYVKLHGGKSIAFGRFIPGVKAVVPGIVGMFGMNQLYFLVVNVTSGLVWTIAHIAPGILIGQGLALAGELSGRLVIVLLVLLVVLAVAGWLIRLLAATASPYKNRLLLKISNWAKSRRSRPMHRLGRALAPDNPRSKILLLFMLIIIAGLIAFVDIMSGLFLRDAVSNLDLSINNLMGELRNGPADTLMVGITMLGDTPVILAVATVIIAWLFWRRAWRSGVAVIAFLVFGKVLDLIIKALIERPRPTGGSAYSGWDAFSFPSGHAMMAALTFGILAVLVSHPFNRWTRALVFSSTAMLVIAIGFSRVYLGAHWLSDVVGGMVLGVALVALFGVVVEAIPPRRFGPIGLLGASSLALTIAGYLHINISRDTEMPNYVANDKVVESQLVDWAKADWSNLPARRIDLAGKPEEIFTAQWAGDVQSLKNATTTLRWQPVDRWTWREGMAYLDPNAALATTPPRPALHEGLQAKFTAIINDGAAPQGQRLVLRAYKSKQVVSDNGNKTGVLLISVTRETLRSTLSLYAVPVTSEATPTEQAAAVAALTSSNAASLIIAHEVSGSVQSLLKAGPKR